VPAVSGDRQAAQVLLVARMVPGAGYLQGVGVRCVVGPGLQGGEGLGFALVLSVLLCLLFLPVAFEHLLDQAGDGAFALGGFADFRGWGEGAQLGMVGGLFDELGLGGLRFGEVEAGDLETVEKEAGAAGVDVVGGDALENLADGVLDGRTIFREGDFEGGAAAPAGARVGCGLACGVVVVAEVFSAEAGAAATVAVGEDVAALEAFGCFGLWLDGVVHGPSPRGYFLVQSLRKKRVESGLRPSSRLKGEGPAFWPGLFFFLLLFYRIGWN
jgi:hypothetical protein